MKKAICIILAVAAAMTFIVSRRPDPAAVYFTRRTHPRGRREM